MGASVFYESSSELARLSNTFTVSGAPTDPTTVTLTLTSPSGTSSSYTYAAAQIIKDSVGVYHKDVTCSEAGEWTYQWVGTGAATDTTVGTFTVQEATLGRLYATVDALKSRLSLAPTDRVDDYELHSACFAASRAIEQHTQRVFWRSAPGTVRTFVPEYVDSLTLPPFCEVVSVSEVAIDTAGDGTYSTVWTSGQYQLWPVNTGAGPEAQPYTEIRPTGSTAFPNLSPAATRRNRVRVTGVYGWPSVPHPIRQAALMLAQEIFKSKDTVGGVAGFGEFGVVRVQRNPLLDSLVGPYQRYPVVLV